MSTFSTILIANRGEIACRIIRSAHALGYRTVAVYSQADADAPHVGLADRAVLIGPPPVRESYLNVERLLAAAADAGADAVHPGYGFLSENAEFAQACLDAGLVFIGPSPHAIHAMGNKAEAKRAMIAAGVPCIPGFQDSSEAGQSDEALHAAALKVGLPVLVKAAAGGGGRGMRKVKTESELAAAIRSARSEAASAFGSGELIVERAIVDGRHVALRHHHGYAPRQQLALFHAAKLQAAQQRRNQCTSLVLDWHKFCAYRFPASYRVGPDVSQPRRGPYPTESPVRRREPSGALRNRQAMRLPGEPP